jgi:hypothetical protein
VTSENIFSALAKYNSAVDENYLTEAFVFLINSLLTKERSIALEILTKLCVKNSEFSFGENEPVSVSTQETTEQGRPDIKVSSPDKLIYIEVKHDSPLGHQQLERYKKALESSTKAIKHVALLTRFAIDYQENEERPYKHVRWFEVYNWLANTKAQDPVSVYLIESFKSFLEVKQMSIQKVGWEYINGVPALTNLINMIEAAIQGASLPIYAKSPGWDFKGFYVESNKFWCGIDYSEPLVMVFRIEDQKHFNSKLVDKPNYPMTEDRYAIRFLLQFEDKHFFSLDKDKQLEEITKFVKISYEEAQQMRIKE